MGDAPRDHHYIPKFYTKQWCSPDGKIVRFTKEHGKLIDRRVYPEQVGKQRDLYSVPDMPSGQEQVLESEYYKHVDNLAAASLHKFTRDPVPTLAPPDRENWCHFIYSIYHRTPYNLAAIKAAGGNAWRNSITDVIERLRRETDRTDLDELEHQLMTGDKNASERLTLLGLPQMTSNSRVIQMLLDMHWRVLKFPETEYEFLLSDNPLVQSDGLLRPDGHIAMPLGPHRLLLMTRDPKFQDVITNQTSPSDIVRAVNTWIVESARHFVVGRDLKQKRFIENRFGRIPKRALAEGPLIKCGTDA
jgi:hypothetical protein